MRQSILLTTLEPWWLSNPSSYEWCVGAVSGAERLTPRQERDLVIAAEAGDAEACRMLVEAFLPAIAAIARRYHGVGVERQDSFRREWPACCSPPGVTTPS